MLGRPESGPRNPTIPLSIVAAVVGQFLLARLLSLCRTSAKTMYEIPISMIGRRMASTKFISEPRKLRIRLCFLLIVLMSWSFIVRERVKACIRKAEELDGVQVPNRRSQFKWTVSAFTGHNAQSTRIGLGNLLCCPERPLTNQGISRGAANTANPEQCH